jgi:hypothetical protein
VEEEIESETELVGEAAEGGAEEGGTSEDSSADGGE